MKRIFLVLLIACLTHVTYAQTSNAGGVWTTGTNWVGNVAPVPGSINANVVVNHIMTFASGASFSGSGTRTITVNSGGSIRVTGNMNMTSSSIHIIINTGGTLEVSGTLTVNNQSQITLQGGVVNAGSLTMTSNANSRFNYTSGTLNLTGNLFIGAAEIFGYTPSLGVPGNISILNGGTHTVTTLGGTITLNNTSKLTLNTGGTVTPTTITFSGSNCEIVVSSGTLNYNSALSINGGNKLTLNGGTTNLQSLTVGSAGTVTLTSGATLTATSLTTTNNSNALFDNSGTVTVGTPSVNGNVSSSGVIVNSGTMTVNGNYTQANTGNSTTNSGNLYVTGNTVANGLIQLNPGTSTDSNMFINGTLTVNANPWIIVGTNTASPCSTLMTRYANLVVQQNLILTGSGDVTVNQNGRLAVFGDITRTSGGGTLITVNCGGQVYVDGDIDIGTGGGNNVTNSNGAGSPTGSNGLPVIGLYVNGTTTAQNVSGTVGNQSDLQSNNSPFFSWIGTLPNSPLPITLTFFKVHQINSYGVDLKWQTSMEENFDYFLVERAGEDLNFKAISKIKGKGGIDINISYEYLDSTPLEGKNYYRLKSVDYDWAFEYSDLVYAEWNFESKESEVTVYPNPIVNHTFTLELNEEVNSFSSMTLLNSMGKEIFQQSIRSDKEFIFLQNDLKPGIYYVKIMGTNLSKTIKVIIQ